MNIRQIGNVKCKKIIRFSVFFAFSFYMHPLISLCKFLHNKFRILFYTLKVTRTKRLNACANGKV